MTDSDKPKATIEHKLVKPVRPSDWHLLSTYAVLATLPDRQHPQSVIYRTKVMQSQVRFQMYRWISENPEKAYSGTYELNCPPTGLLVRPKTKFCNNPVVCPWCFVRRRLVPIYEAIKAVPVAARKGSKIVAVRAAYSPTEQLPFFRNDRGPHQWHGSLVTAQTVTPFPAVDDEDLKEKEEDKVPSRLDHVFHVVQVVPESLMLPSIVDGILKRAGHPLSTSAVELPYTSLTNVIRVLSGTYTFPWLQLCAKRNLELFSQIKAGYSEQRLLRINTFKKEKISEHH
jgi:hypothetical protein